MSTRSDGVPPPMFGGPGSRGWASGLASEVINGGARDRIKAAVITEGFAKLHVKDWAIEEEGWTGMRTLRLRHRGKLKRYKFRDDEQVDDVIRRIVPSLQPRPPKPRASERGNAVRQYGYVEEGDVEGVRVSDEDVFIQTS